MGVLFASLSAVLYSLWFLFSKISVNKTKDPIAAVVVFQVLAGLLFLPLSLFDTPKADINADSVLLTVAAILCYTFFNVLGFKSFKYLDVSVAGILSQTTVIVTFIGGLIVFNEDATSMKVIGVLLVILGNVIIHINSDADTKVKMKGVILRLAASLMLALGILIDAKNLENFSIPVYGFLTYLIPGLISYIFIVKSFDKIKADFSPNKLLFLVMSAMATSGYYFLLKSFTTDLDKTISAPINSSSSMLVVIWGIIFLKETDKLTKKIIAGIIVFLGVVLLGIA
ncbi:DMT family transporter [Candidatus Dojkabacteria bacterium]|uniref:DMT family transporter n=1 Tax=Candidatus Dojkabacteria bacterium TaxID=2099670 RepID=A0A955L4S8_9BACT|nr:DMT family transporter [Candidatus Dojkabacteria bacterium]